MGKKLFWGGVIIVILSWIGNYLYFQSQQLESPILLKHYYDREYHQVHGLPIYFINNKNDSSQVSYAIIDGGEVYPKRNNLFNSWVGDQPQKSYHKTYTHHAIEFVDFFIPEEIFQEKKDEKGVWSFSEITLVFNDGRKVMQNIGEIFLRDEPKSSKEILEPTYTGGVQPPYSKDSYIFLKDAIINEIYIPFAEQLSGDLTFKIIIGENEFEWNEQAVGWQKVNADSKKDENIFPIYVNEGERLDVLVNLPVYFPFNLEFSYYILGELKEGTPFTRQSGIFRRALVLRSNELKEVISNFERSVD